MAAGGPAPRSEAPGRPSLPCGEPWPAQGGTPGAARAAAAAPDELDADAVRTWSSLAVAALGRAREDIDAINVYPVADADTGTNLYLTAESADRALAAALGTAPADVSETTGPGPDAGSRTPPSPRPYGPTRTAPS